MIMSYLKKLLDRNTCFLPRKLWRGMCSRNYKLRLNKKLFSERLGKMAMHS